MMCCEHSESSQAEDITVLCYGASVERVDPAMEATAVRDMKTQRFKKCCALVIDLVNPNPTGQQNQTEHNENALNFCQE